MKNRVTISPMTKSINNGEDIVKDFITEAQARDYFEDWCNEHGYKIEDGETEAGGVGHDYRVTLHS